MLGWLSRLQGWRGIWGWQTAGLERCDLIVCHGFRPSPSRPSNWRLNLVSCNASCTRLAIEMLALRKTTNGSRAQSPHWKPSSVRPTTDCSRCLIRAHAFEHHNRNHMSFVRTLMEREAGVPSGFMQIDRISAHHSIYGH